MLRLPRVLHHRNYRLAWLGVFISNIGTWMETVGVGIYVTRATGEAKWTATVAALIFLPALVLGPMGGALADRFDRRRYLVVVTLVQMMLALLLTVLALAGRLSVPVVGVTMMLTGCASSLLNPAFTALIVDFVPPEDVTGAINLNSAQFNLARILGPALTVPVIKWMGLGWAFALNTVSFIAVLVALSRVVVTPQQETHQAARGAAPRESLWAGLVRASRTARADAGIRSALLMVFLGSFLLSPFIGLVPVFAIQVLHRDEAATSGLVIAQGLGAILMALLVTRLSDRYGRGKLLAASCSLIGPVCAVYWLSPTYGMALGALFVLGALHLGAITGCNTICQARAPSAMRARISSLYSMVVAAGYTTGLPALGFLGDRFGLRLVAVFAAALHTAALIQWRLLRPGLFQAMEGPAYAPRPSIPSLSSEPTPSPILEVPADR